ncbi:MAG: hypothetical protein CFE34_09090 [Rhodobacteraceae bacterium PARR1]|nr:MAG: hypothetical protein CFE34_09090 [Rhodobacteraceae bacterium PARR1]
MPTHATFVYWFWRFYQVRDSVVNSENKESLLREATRLAELSLTAQVDLMLAADQRATTFAGIMIATVAIIAQDIGKVPDALSDDLGLILLGVSAALAAYSARSVKIHIGGNSFSSFAEELKSNRDLALLLRDLGEIYDQCSAKNRTTMKRNSNFFNTSLYIGILGFFVSIWTSLVSIFWELKATLVALAGAN